MKRFKRWQKKMIERLYANGNTGFRLAQIAVVVQRDRSDVYNYLESKKLLVHQQNMEDK